jgi:hypothetical protein
MGFFLFVNSLFEGLTLLMKQSDICAGVCTLNTGAKCCISAIVFWFLAAISVATVPAPAGPEPIVIQETTTTTTRVEPDGTQVTETKVDKMAELISFLKKWSCSLTCPYLSVKLLQIVHYL